MIKRVEFFTNPRSDKKPNRIVSYYLFGFLLIYQSVRQEKDNDILITNSDPTKLSGYGSNATNRKELKIEFPQSRTVIN